MMIHILLLILKILGFVLLAAVGVLLTLLAVIILAPFRYEIRCSGDGSRLSVNGKALFSWMLHFISGQISCLDGNISWKLRVGWKHFSSEKSNDNDTETESEDRTEKSRDETPIKTVTTEKSAEHEEGAKSERPLKEDIPVQDNPRPEQTSQEKSFFEKWRDKIRKQTEKIKYTFHQFCGKIKLLIRKKERLKKFVGNELHKRAFLRFVREVKRLLHFLRPKKLEAEVEFGLDDPAETGYLLALISMIYPLIGEHTVIRPDFEHSILRGRLEASGKVRIIYAVIPVFNLIRNRDVRITYRHIKKFRL